MRLKSMSYQYDYSLPDISSIDDKQQKDLDLYIVDFLSAFSSHRLTTEKRLRWSLFKTFKLSFGTEALYDTMFWGGEQLHLSWW